MKLLLVLFAALTSLQANAKNYPASELALADLRIGPIATINNDNAKILRIAVTAQSEIGFDVDERIIRTKVLNVTLEPVVLGELTSIMPRASLYKTPSVDINSIIWMEGHL